MNAFISFLISVDFKVVHYRTHFRISSCPGSSQIKSFHCFADEKVKRS
jgi:hypothetical protein